MNKDDYISASISTRMYEKNLLTRTDFERLNDYDSVREVLNQLNDTIYRESINNLDRAEAVSYTHLTLPTICSV